MCEKGTVQSSILELYVEHEIGKERKSISNWLDGNPKLSDWVATDVKNRNIEETRPDGLSHPPGFREAAYEFFPVKKWVGNCLLS